MNTALSRAASNAALLGLVLPSSIMAQSVEPPDRADTTPFLSVKHVEGTKDSQIDQGLCYLRLDVTPVSQGGVTQVGHTPSGFLRRLTRATDYSFTSVLKVKVADYEESVVLYSRKYQSSRENGETHDRMQLVNGNDYPVFLLDRDSNGSAGVAISADMKNTQTFSLAGSALEAVAQGLKAVAPAAGIVTTLTSESAGDVASAIDRSAGAFMGAAGSNAEPNDLDLRRGDTLEVSIFGPKYEVDPNERDFTLGTWKVSFPVQFASYFYKDVRCEDGQDEAWARRGERSNILAEDLIRNVSDFGTLGSYLRQLDWWDDGRVAIDSKPAKDEEVENFCRQIVAAVSTLGFNSVDGFLVADAVARSPMVSRDEGAAMLGSDACDFDKRQAQLQETGDEAGDEVAGTT